MREIGVGLIGFGLAGRVFHAPTITATAGLRLAAIVQRHGDDAAQAYPSVAVVRSVEELLSRPEVELVVVATPNATHFPLAMQALRSGRHVVVDKPFALRQSDAEALLHAAKEHGRTLSVFQNRRWDGDFLTVRRVLEYQALGDVAEFTSRFDRYRPQLRPGAWKESAQEGSGILWDLGPHLVDQALTLFGPPRTVQAWIRAERKGPADDSFELRLDYDNLVVRLGANALSAAPTPRWHLRGTSGAFVKYGLDPQEQRLKDGDHYKSAEWGREPESLWGTLYSGSSAQRIETLPGDYRAYYANVVAAIRGESHLAVTAEQALTTTRVIQMAFQSAHQQRALAW